MNNIWQPLCDKSITTGYDILYYRLSRDDDMDEESNSIAEHIANQLKEDEIHDQMTMKEYTDPFTGSR